MAYTDYLDQVQRLYMGYYLRPADPAGLVYWAQQLDAADGDLTQIIAAFADAPESEALWGEITEDNIEDFVNDVYNALFNRDAEVDPDTGENWWVTQFNLGNYSAEELVLAILEGAQGEDLAIMENKLDWSNTFTGILDPDPDMDPTDDAYEYAGDADADAARALLAAVDADTVIDEDTIEQQIIDFIAGPQPNPGEEFDLTPGNDHLTGTDGDDTFYGVLGMLNVTTIRETTFNSGDILNGGDGNDTLVLTAESDYSEANIVEMSNIENVVVRNFADTDLDLDAFLWSGVDNYGVNSGSEDVSISYIGEGFSTITMENIREDEFTFSLEVDNDVFSGDDDEVTVVLKNAGAGPVRVPQRTLDNDHLGGGQSYSETIEGVETNLSLLNYNGDGVIETLNIVSTGGNSRGNLLKLGADDGSMDYTNESIRTLNITGDTDLYLRQSDSGSLQLETVDASGLDANFEFRGGMGALSGPHGVTIIGATGNNDVTGSYYDDTITTFGGNDVIKGNGGSDVINAGDGDNEVRIDGDYNVNVISVTTGSGNDVIHIGDYNGLADSDITVIAGSGDDEVKASDTLNAGDSVDGGIGTDTLFIHNTSATTATTDADNLFEGLFTGFEAIGIRDLNGTVDMDYLDGIQHVILTGNLYAANIIEGLHDDATLEIQYYNANNAAAVTTVDTNATTFNLLLNGDAYGFANDGDGSLVDTDHDLGTLVLDNVDELNITTGTDCRDFDVTDADGTADGIDISFLNYNLGLDMDSLETLNIDGGAALNLLGVALTTVSTVAASHFDAALGLLLAGNTNNVLVTVGDGDNIIIGGDGKDAITVGDGDNIIEGMGGDDKIIAGDGDNQIFGNIGNDTITTGAGDDILTGGAGIDTLTGGDGADTFYYDAVGDSQGTTVDVINGFVSGEDQLDLSWIVAVDYLGEAAGYGSVLTSFGGVAGQAVLDSDTSILYVDVDGSATLDNADMAIKLAGVTDLDAATDFV